MPTVIPFDTSPPSSRSRSDHTGESTTKGAPADAISVTVTQLNDRQESPLVQALVRTLITTRDQSSVPPSFLLLSADLKKTVRSRTVGQSSPNLLLRISQQHRILPELTFSPRLRPFPFLCVTMEGLRPLKICQEALYDIPFVHPSLPWIIPASRQM